MSLHKHLPQKYLYSREEQLRQLMISWDNLEYSSYQVEDNYFLIETSVNILFYISFSYSYCGGK